MAQCKYGSKKIMLTDDVMTKLKVLRAYKYTFSITKSLTWSDDGDILLACSGNNTVTINTLRPISSNRTLYSKMNGVNVVRFLDKTNNIIACSCKAEKNAEYKNYVRYWDIAENKYLKSLPQIGTVCNTNGISISSNKKLMLINTDDGHVKLYYINMNTDTPLMLYKSSFERPVSTFDNEGEIFIASFGNENIYIYEVAMYSKGECNILNLKKILNKDEYITNLLFTPTNQYVIVSTNKNFHFKIDSITGEYICSYKHIADTTAETRVTHYDDISEKESLHVMNTENGKRKMYKNLNKLDKEYFDYDIDLTYSEIDALKNEAFTNSFFFPTVTPDEKYVIIGGTDAGVHIWKEDGTYLTSLYGHEGPPYNVAFNPQCAILGSSYLNIVMWQPRD